jgi:hypothetical protein
MIKIEVRRIYNYDGMVLEADKCQLLCCNCHRKKSKYEKPYDELSPTYLKRKTAREYVSNVKLMSNGCSDCGWFDENYLNVLDFDHISLDDKKYDISRMVSRGLKTNLIEKEIQKTRILCSNCHRKHTLRQFNYPILDIINKIELIWIL